MFARITESADLLLLAGDLTDYGLPEEARVLAKELMALRSRSRRAWQSRVESGKADEVTKIRRGRTHVLTAMRELLGIGIAGVGLRGDRKRAPVPG